MFFFKNSSVDDIAAALYYFCVLLLDILYLIAANFCSLDIPLNLLPYYLFVLFCFRTLFCETPTVNH